MRRKILLVEDDENMRFMLQDNLEMAGYNTCALGDGQTALSTFVKEEFDLCIFDVMLPKKDGFTLAADIRKLSIDSADNFFDRKRLKRRTGSRDSKLGPMITSLNRLVLRSFYYGLKSF